MSEGGSDGRGGEKAAKQPDYRPLGSFKGWAFTLGLIKVTGGPGRRCTGSQATTVVVMSEKGTPNRRFLYKSMFKGFVLKKKKNGDTFIEGRRLGPGGM